MIALDTNLLVYAHLPSTPEHKAARGAIERALGQDSCGIALPTISEFWGIVTNSNRVAKKSLLTDAQAFLRELTQEAGIVIWSPAPKFQQQLIAEATRLEICGAKIFDLQIALIAKENKASEIWTHDKNFVRLQGLSVYDPIG